MRTRRSQFSGNPMLSRPSFASSLSLRATAGTHRSVLLHEAITLLEITPGDTVVDATLGGAGHALAIIGKLGKHGVFVGFDLDSDAIGRAKEMFKDAAPKVYLVEANFRDMSAHLKKLGVTKIDKILFDLGWSSFQLDAGRGFSLKSHEPLLMTYAKYSSQTAVSAATIVNEWAEESIADVIFGWGEERYSRRIAKAIVERRESKPFTSARELADAIYAAVPPRYRFGRIHPATRTFQALRIAVNDELGALTQGLHAAWNLLSGPSPRRSGLPPREGGRIAVITFHSIEDRLVKQTFKQWEEAREGRRINKKPLSPSAGEIAENPRSRSAKLRAIQKI